MKYIAFVCGHNSGRSQLAQGAFNKLKAVSPEVDAEFEAISWGTGIDPNSGVNKKIVPVAKTVGIDLTDESTYFPKNADDSSLVDRLPNVAKVITMGCMKTACELPPMIEGVDTDDIEDWGLEDPASEDTDIATVTNQILGNCLKLIQALK